MLKKRLILVTVLVLLIFPVINLSVDSQDENPWWNESWSYRKEIDIPFETDNYHAKFQPIDINFEFKNPCFAKNEKNHSIRVIYQKGGIFRELESQIYDLNYSSEKIISDCSIVFLIPEFADGEEQYFVYYDGESKKEVSYDDHVSVQDSYYRYEPVSGLSFNSWYYGISQNNYLVYAVVKEGNALGDSLSQKVTKLKKKSTDILPKNGEQIATFSLNCWINDNGGQTFFSTSEKLVFSDILVDGNLMVKIIVISSTENDLIKTTNVYKYYYCPSNNHKRLYTQVNHEFINGPLPEGDTIDISFGGLKSGGIKSNIEELDSGDIPPFLHFYSEKERVVTYEMDTDPEGIDWREMIGYEDDCDIGSFSWLSVDYGESGKAHGLVLDSNEVIETGTDERNGVQIQLYEANSIQLPNIDGKFASLYITRNKHEPGLADDNILPENYVVKYSADFFSTEIEGYKKVEDEALFFQKLAEFQPVFENGFNKITDNQPTYNLLAYADLPASIKNKFRLSKLLLRNTYLSAELYKDNKLIGLSIVGRFPLTEEYWIDWGNISIYKKAIFNNLESGRYLVKIYVNNLFLENNDKFIGYKIIDLNENTSVTIDCNREGKIRFNSFNQYDKPIEDVKLQITEDDVIISEKKTSDEGYLLTGLPCGIGKEYKIRILYKGFLVREETIKLGLSAQLFAFDIVENIDLFNLEASINELESDNEPELFLYSNDMVEENRLTPQKDNNRYVFSNLVSSDYNLEIRYDDFIVEEKIDLSKNTSFEVNLKDIDIKVFDLWDLKPDAAIDIWLKTNSFKKNIVISPVKTENNKYFFTNLYPGKYNIKLTYKKDIFEKEILINGNKDNFSIVFPARFNITTEIYDSHGDLINNAVIKLKRENITKTKKTSDGSQVFNLPPGEYICSVYNDDKLISKQKINVLSDREISIVTNKESNNLYYIFIVFIPVILVLGLFLYKKDKLFLFLKILAIFLVISSLIFPWWSINNEKNDSIVKTETDMYVIPAEMITITAYEDYSSGEFSSLDEDFVSAIDYIPYLILAGVVFLLFNIFLKHKSYKNLAKLFLFFSSLLFIICTVLFILAMSIFSDALVGGLFGSDVLNINVPGKSGYEELRCIWGLDLGFYLMLIGTVIIAGSFLSKTYVYLKNRIKIIYLKEE